MEDKIMPQLSNRVGTFTDSVIRRMTRISDAYGAINLSQGFPDFDPPKEIMDALAKAAYQGPHQYSVTYGAPNFRQALAKKQGKTINREIDPEKEIVVTCGGTEAMMCAMMTICNPGDKVMVFSPFYENYGADAILSGADPIYIPLIPPEYEFDINLIEQGFRDGAKAIIICNPSNPCGKVFREDELLAIGKLALKYDAFVVTDEVYEHMVYEPNKHICMASLPGMYEHTITCNSLSKTYSITGWRLGYICGPSVIIEQMLKIHQFAIMCAPTNSQYAAIEGLRHCEDEVQQMRNAYNQRRRYLVNEFAKMKLECFEPFGAFYIFPSIKEFVMTSEEFAMRFLEEEKVAVVPGSAFGESGEGFLRVSYAYSLEDLKEAIGRLSRFVERLRSQK